MPSSASRELTDQTIADTLAKFQVPSSPGLCHAIRDYVDLLLLWNQKVSLTSITSPLEILSRHFGESMFAAQAVPDLHGRLADVGSGPGFPGLALKILRPDLEVFLIESVMKKATFLAEVTRHLGLSNVKVVVSRFEDLRDDLAPLDFICARALGDRPSLLAWATLNLNIGGQVVLWLGAGDANQLRSGTATSPADASTPGRPPDPGTRDHVAYRTARENAADLTTGDSAADNTPQAAPPSNRAPEVTTSSPDTSSRAHQGDPSPAPQSSHKSANPFLYNTGINYNVNNVEVADAPATPPSPPDPRTLPLAIPPNAWAWDPPLPIPESLNRYLIVGKPFRSR